jgi:endo-1,4-beta-xylanase
MPNRRDALAILVAAAMAGASTPAKAQAGRLRDAFAAKGVLFGAFVSHELIGGYLQDPDYLKLVSAQAGLIAGEHGTSPYTLWQDATTPNFTGLDRELFFAQSNQLPYYGWLLWNDWVPDWLQKSSPAETRKFMERHFEVIMKRDAGRARYWQVVNEPIWVENGLKNGMRDGPYSRAMPGDEYIKWAFKRAREMAPKARLVLSEAHLERADRYGRLQRPAFLALLDRLLDAGTPIDAVALQGHVLSYAPDAGYASDGVREVVDHIAKRKLGVIISEFDVDDRTFPNDIPERDRRVAEAAGKFLRDVFSTKKPELFISFGMSDKFTWMKSIKAHQDVAAYRKPRPLPFDEAMRPKLLRDMMVERLAELA